jgi:glycine betaine/proline transport system substrate-binding protein
MRRFAEWGAWLFKIGVIFLACSFVLLPLNVCAGKGTIRFSDRSWDTIQVHNRIAGFIIEHGYGYETAAGWAAIMRGDLDVNMESWTENYQEIYDRAVKEGKIIDLGPNFPDSWQGWLVPTYMIKGDPERGIKPVAPDLKTVFDLKKYSNLFKDPEEPDMGRFHNCIPGWSCSKINTQKLKVYGLDKNFSDFITGSDTALVGSMVKAYKKGKPWVGYYWAPTWVLGKLDMTPLEEPAYDPDIWKATKGCAYKSISINILVNSSLPKRAPELIEFLKKYETTLAENNDFLVYMQDTKCSTEEAAKWYLKKYKDKWKNWVPAEVAGKVEEAL